MIWNKTSWQNIKIWIIQNYEWQIQWHYARVNTVAYSLLENDNQVSNTEKNGNIVTYIVKENMVNMFNFHNNLNSILSVTYMQNIST